MSVRGNALAPGAWREADYRLPTAVGLILATYALFFLCLYWFMQPSVSANAGLAAYRPPPKTVVRYADSPQWVPPDSSEVFPIRATGERPPVITKPSVAEEPKKAAKKQEASTSARRARPVVREQQNPFWGFASSPSSPSSPRSYGSRPWF